MCSYCNQARRLLPYCLDAGRTPSPQDQQLGTVNPPANSKYQMRAGAPEPRPSSSASRLSATASASVSGYYPGSNFARTPPATRPETAQGNTSSLSVVSAEYSIHSVESSESIRKLARKISMETAVVNDLKNELDSWHQKMDKVSYLKRSPWTSGMENAYTRYKSLANQLGEAHQAFRTLSSQTRPNAKPEDYVRRAQLAVLWGEAAVRAAEARLEFMKTYKDAYYLPAIQTHINEGAAIISSAKKAVSEARKNYNQIWGTALRAGSPAVFQ